MDSVDQQAVRDRYANLQQKNKRKNAEEKRSSGISPEETPRQAEITSQLEEMAALEEDMEAGVKMDESQKDEQKRIDSLEMRKRLVETFAESSKR